MGQKINERFIRDLCQLRNNGNSTLNTTLVELTQMKNAYLNFLLYITFGDIYNELSCPRPFNLLMRSGKIIIYLRQRLLGRDMPRDPGETMYKRRKTSTGHIQYHEDEGDNEMYNGGDVDDLTSENDFVEIMRFLLNMEKGNRRTSCVDRPFIRSVLSRIPETKKVGLIRLSGITPLSILVMETVNLDSLTTIQLEVVNFLKAKNMPYEKGFAYAHKSGIDFKTLRRVFLSSKFPEIQEYFHILVEFYPEVMFDMRSPYNGRLEIFRDPLCIPNNIRLMCAYIPASTHFIKRRLASLGSIQNLEILLKTIYIERIFARCPKKLFLKGAVHQFILETPVLVQIIVTRGFRNDLIDRIVKYVPSFHLAYDLSLKMLCKDPTNQFYLELTEKLLRMYPTEGNVEKFRACSHLFQEPFINRLDYLQK